MKNNRKKVFKLSIILVSILIILIFFINITNASALVGWWWENSTAEAVTFLQTHSDWLQFGSFFTVILHELGWLLIKGLYCISSLLEGLIPETFNLLKFLDYAGVQGIVSAIINDLVVTLMVLTLVYLGFKTVIAKEPPKFKDMGVNIFISAFLILGMPTLMNTMQDISIKFYNDTQTSTNNQQTASLSWNLIQSNTADLVYAAQQGFDLIKNDSGDTTKNSLTPDIFKAVDLSELITTDAIKKVEFDNNELKYLNYNLSTDGQGNLTATEIDGNFLSFFSDNFDSGYFRYPSKFFTIIIGLVALTVAYIFNLFVLITTIIEIGIKRIVGLFVFATDLESGQRTKMVVQDILNAFMLIAFTGLSLNLYTVFLTFLGTIDLNVIVYLISLVSATFVLIKGSNTIMRYFGVDVGLKDGFAQMAGAFAVGKTMSDIAKRPFDKSKSKSRKRGQNSENRLSKNEDDIKSINNNGTDKVKKGINTAGKTIGYMKERRIQGITEDAVKSSEEKIAQKGRGIANNAKDLKDSFKEGIENGVSVGQSNKEKWHGKAKPIEEANEENIQNNRPKAEDKNSHKNDSNNISINDSQKKQSGNSSASAIEMRKQRLEQELNTVNPNTTENATRHITDVIGEKKPYSDSKTKLNQELTPKIESNGNIKMNDNGKKSINQDVNAGLANSNKIMQEVLQEVKPGQINSSPLSQETTQEIKQEVKPGQVNNKPLRQETTQEIKQEVKTGQPSNAATRQTIIQDIKQGVIVGHDSVQRIKQQVDRVGYSNGEQVKQKIIQEVQRSGVGNTEGKQRVIQEIEKSSVATPQQAQQNVQQVLQSARVPQQVNDIVQRVIKDVQPGTNNIGDVKAKVIQELEQISFGTKEPIKQAIIQNVEKGFCATPEQMKQNIKQVIKTETTATQNVVETVEGQQTCKKSGYFGSIFGQSLDEYEKAEPKNKSTFNFIKNV